MKPRWVEEPGYYETHRYIESDGRISAEIHGSKFQERNGWTAFDTRGASFVHLGRYEKMEQAKAAAMRALAASSEAPK